MNNKKIKNKTSINVKVWRRTIGAVAVILVIGFGMITGSLVNVQLIQGEELQRKAINQQLRDTTISAQRGTIYDRNMKVLAQSASVWTVAIDPKFIEKEDQKDFIAKGLAPILSLDETELREKLNKNSRYEIVKKQVEEGVKNEITQFKEEVAKKYKDTKKSVETSIMLIPDNKRYYPYGDFASSVLGFVGSDNQGLNGLEAQYDSELTGIPGRIVSVKNARGTNMDFEYQRHEDAQDGNSLILSIDEGIQRIVERNLEQAVIDNQVKQRGIAIAMDVKTGEILAMANKGDYDPNEPFVIQDEVTKAELELIEDEEERKTANNKALQLQWRNKTVSDTYEPGSVFKIVTAAMALEEDIMVNDTFYCSGSMMVGDWDKPIKCHKTTGHGSQTFAEILQNSCNPGFMTLGRNVGAKRFSEYFSAFGLTEKTGIDLPGEATSIYHSEADLNEVSLAVCSFGQTFKITPIQMITSVAAVANGGNLVQPHVVKQVVDSDGNIVKTADTTVKRQVISKETSETLCEMLETVVSASTGTGKNARVTGYKIAGKTGTSEKKDTPQADDRIASFCGFAPADDPQIALLVFFDDPQGDSKYGSTVAAPVFASIMDEVLPYMGVERTYSEAEREYIDTITPDINNLTLNEAKTKILEAKLEVKVYGNGEKVIRQIPEAGQLIPQNGKVVIYTDEDSLARSAVVPDFCTNNYTLKDVNYLAQKDNVNISVSGAALGSSGAVANKQSIPPGTVVPPGTVIKVEFITQDQVE